MPTVITKPAPAPSRRLTGLLPACIALACGLAPASLWAQSVITEDDLAAAHERPTVLKTANGLPQIDIQTPDDAGISMNRYSQFDVDSAGAIMNNALIPAAIIVNLVFWQKDANLTRLILGAVIMYISLLIHNKIMKFYGVKVA